MTSIKLTCGCKICTEGHGKTFEHPRLMKKKLHFLSKQRGTKNVNDNKDQKL